MGHLKNIENTENIRLTSSFCMISAYGELNATLCDKQDDHDDKLIIKPCQILFS